MSDYHTIYHINKVSREFIETIRIPIRISLVMTLLSGVIFSMLGTTKKSPVQNLHYSDTASVPAWIFLIFAVLTFSLMVFLAILDLIVKLTEHLMALKSTDWELEEGAAYPALRYEQHPSINDSAISRFVIGLILTASILLPRVVIHRIRR